MNTVQLLHRESGGRKRPVCSANCWGRLTRDLHGGFAAVQPPQAATLK